MIDPDCYVFRQKSDGWITVSRHENPDFVAHLTKEQILEFFDVVPVHFVENKVFRERVTSMIDRAELLATAFEGDRREGAEDILQYLRHEELHELFGEEK